MGTKELGAWIDIGMRTWCGNKKGTRVCAQKMSSTGKITLRQSINTLVQSLECFKWRYLPTLGFKISFVTQLIESPDVLFKLAHHRTYVLYKLLVLVPKNSQQGFFSETNKNQNGDISLYVALFLQSYMEGLLESCLPVTNLVAIFCKALGRTTFSKRNCTKGKGFFCCTTVCAILSMMLCSNT